MTRVFPQLETGAVTQFPFSKRTFQRVILNEAADGSTVRAADPFCGAIEWTLTFKHISDDELGRLSRFFDECHGRLLDFTFGDPTDNLLAWSEQLDEPVWETGPWLAMAPGLSDPIGTDGAWQVSNTGPSPARLAQTIEYPNDRVCSFSLYARSGAASTISLVRRGTTDELAATQAIGTVWQRVSLRCAGIGSGPVSQFGVDVPPGGVVELFGLQAEAQPSPSYYKRTASRCGIYLNSRLLSDELEFVTNGPNSHSATIGIRSRLSA